MEYNGSNYYEGMEYKIMEEEKEKEKERERESKMYEEELDDFFNDNEINQIKNNIHSTMNKNGGNNNAFNNKKNIINNIKFCNNSNSK